MSGRREGEEKVESRRARSQGLSIRAGVSVNASKATNRHSNPRVRSRRAWCIVRADREGQKGTERRRASDGGDDDDEVIKASQDRSSIEREAAAAAIIIALRSPDAARRNSLLILPRNSLRDKYHASGRRELADRKKKRAEIEARKRGFPQNPAAAFRRFLRNQNKRLDFRA